jgi:hypothetical protein
VTGLAERGGEQGSTGDHARQVPTTLLIGAEIRDRERAQPDSGQQGHRRDVAADLLEQHAQLHEAVTAAAEGLGKRNAHQVRVGELLPHTTVERLRRVLQLEETLGRDLLAEDLARQVA